MPSMFHTGTPSTLCVHTPNLTKSSSTANQAATAVNERSALGCAKKVGGVVRLADDRPERPPVMVLMPGSVGERALDTEMAPGEVASNGFLYIIHRGLALYGGSVLGAGRVCVLGSTQVLSDNFLDKEDNNKLADFIVKWLAPGSPLSLNAVDADDPDIAEHEKLPDTESLSERVRSCLQVEDEIPKDFTSLFSDKLFGYSNDLVPEVMTLYKELNVTKKPLTLIPPAFETPLPPLQPAVFPPIVREPAPPALELFDLDSELASSRSRLAQVANKCAEGTEEDVHFFIQEAGEILGVNPIVAEDDGEGGREVNPKAVLAHVFRQLVSFKSSEPL